MERARSPTSKDMSDGEYKTAAYLEQVLVHVSRVLLRQAKPVECSYLRYYTAKLHLVRVYKWQRRLT